MPLSRWCYFFVGIIKYFYSFCSFNNSGLTINIALLILDSNRTSGHHPKGSPTKLPDFDNLTALVKSSGKLVFLGLFQVKKSIVVSGVVLMLFHKLKSQLDLPVWCLHEIETLYHRVQIVLLEHCNSYAQNFVLCKKKLSVYGIECVFSINK